MSAFFLWNNPSFSDLTIRFDDGDVPGHKIVLAEKSTVFQDCLKDDSSPILDVRGDGLPPILDMTGHHRYFMRVLVYGCVFDEKGNYLRWNPTDMYAKMYNSYNPYSKALDKSDVLQNISPNDIHPTSEEIIDAINLVEMFNIKEAVYFLCEILEHTDNEIASNVIRHWPLWTDNVIKNYESRLRRLFCCFAIGSGSYPHHYETKHLEKLLTLPDEAINVWIKKVDLIYALNFLDILWKKGEKKRSLEKLEIINLTIANITEIELNWFAVINKSHSNEKFREPLERMAISCLLKNEEEVQENNNKNWKSSAIIFLCKKYLERRKRKRDEE